MYDVSVNTILWANNLKSARDVRPGDTLIILPISGVERIVVKGDTLKSLAKKFGADADEIATFNGLDPAEPLEIGSTIIIPGGELILPTPISTSPTARGPIINSGGGTFLPGFFINPVPGSILTQRIHTEMASTSAPHVEHQYMPLLMVSSSSRAGAVGGMAAMVITSLSHTTTAPKHSTRT